MWDSGGPQLLLVHCVHGVFLNVHIGQRRGKSAVVHLLLKAKRTHSLVALTVPPNLGQPVSVPESRAQQPVLWPFLSFLANCFYPGRRVACVGFEELRAALGSHCLSFPVLGFMINWGFCFVLFFFLAEEIKCSGPLYGGLYRRGKGNKVRKFQWWLLGQTKQKHDHCPHLVK